MFAVIISLVAIVLGGALLHQRATHKLMCSALDGAKVRFDDIVESAMDAIITIDEAQRIVLFNTAAESTFHRQRGEVIGQLLETLIPERFRSAHFGHVQSFSATSTTSRRMGGATGLWGLRANGEEFPVEASISQHSEEGRKHFTVILRDVTEHVNALEELRQSKEDLHEFAATAQSLRELEKKRVARELHDEIAQSLAAIKMDLTWVKEGAGDVEQKSAMLETVLSILDDIATTTRRIAADLRPLMLDDLGLIPAIDWLVQNFTQRNNIRCELRVSPQEVELREPYATAIFRILQESLANIARHAQASNVEVDLMVRDEMIVMTVSDDGRGFDQKISPKPDSFGLIGLRERASLLNGNIKINTVPGEGTKVELRLPLEQFVAITS